MARDRERRGKGGPRDDRRRAPKKKVSILNQDSIDWVDYKDVNLLRRFMSERAKIRARRVTGNNAQQQREVARAIRVAREMALLPYSVRQVTQRSRSGRRDRGDRADLSAPMPTPDAPPPVAGEPDELPEGVTVEGGEGAPVEATAPAAEGIAEAPGTETEPEGGADAGADE
jgi:small subunit ribosomal protein S18